MSPAHVESMLWIAAARYYLGRQTADVGKFCAYLIGTWAKLDEGTRGVIRRSVEDAFRRDDSVRQAMPRYPSSTTGLPLGMDCDRREWEQVRELWRPASQPTQDNQPTTMEATP